jgi:BirA family transcriptional regulator, biotin operon repressor / biotin---[acetyl-CoA-carboxylase] ligase
VPDVLNPKAILKDLKTRNLGRRLLFFPQLGSTNAHLMELAAQGEPEGTVVTTDEQTAGRGRFGRTWEAPPGRGLLFSLLLRPKGGLPDASRLSLIAALAVRHAIEPATGLSATLKWPNDVLLNGKKVCGLLGETTTSTGSGGVPALILGIGLNVNQVPEDFPQEFRSQATSLRIETHKEHSRTLLLRKFLEDFEGLYALSEQRGFPHFLDEIRQASAILGKRITVQAGFQAVEGTAYDLDEEGRLLLRLDSGSLTILASGEVTSIRSI